MTQVNEMDTLQFKVVVLLALFGALLLMFLSPTSENSEAIAEAAVVDDQCAEAEAFLQRAVQLQGVAGNIQTESADEERLLKELFEDMLPQERPYYRATSSPLGSLDQELINSAQGQGNRGKQLQRMAERMQVSAQEQVDQHCNKSK